MLLFAAGGRCLSLLLSCSCKRKRSNVRSSLRAACKILADFEPVKRPTSAWKTKAWEPDSTKVGSVCLCVQTV